MSLRRLSKVKLVSNSSAFVINKIHHHYFPLITGRRASPLTQFQNKYHPKDWIHNIATMAAKPHKITVYHLNNSRAIRIISLLEELDLSYTIVYMKRNSTGQAPASFNIHPLRKTPTVVIQHKQGSPEIILHESAYIIDYICEYWGAQFLPKKFADEQKIPGTETEAWRRNRYWLVQPEGTLMPNVQISLLFFCE